MAKGKQKAGKKTAGAKSAKRSSVRDGGIRLQVPNSGLEVWLYDDANREMIRGVPVSGSGGMPAKFDELTQQGLIVGYSLAQDDDLDIAVYVGDPLIESELSAARWLEPQHAFLRLPSGRLCVESNDASRVGSEEPTETGGRVELPGGDYRVTLYRSDYEALDRERLSWNGPQEVIVLTPGGSTADAATDLLPHQLRRDTSWVEKYRIQGNRAEALAWFSDYWDTFVVNLDSAAASKLSLAPGMYFRTHVPAANITLISAFGKSWAEAQRMRPPAGLPLDEYGYAALSPMEDWNGAEALFCRRERTKTRIEDEHHNVWLPAQVQILDAKPLPKTGRALVPSDLGQKEYYDSTFLGVVLSDLLPEAAEADEFTLPMALEALQNKLKRIGFIQQGDLQWEEEIDVGTHEFCCRLYAGKESGLVMVFARDGIFDLLFVTELDDGTWIVTGPADDFEHLVTRARAKGAPSAGITIQCIDEELGKVAAAHRKSVRQSKKQPATAPTNMEECAGILERFLK
ncbi:MAG TPA: hypothetical protein VFS12_06170, partial [Terriglobia bacterium]|nr:hypothetical protein [Terriglobia bacterium]